MHREALPQGRGGACVHMRLHAQPCPPTAAPNPNPNPPPLPSPAGVQWPGAGGGRQEDEQAAEELPGARPCVPWGPMREVQEYGGRCRHGGTRRSRSQRLQGPTDPFVKHRACTPTMRTHAPTTTVMVLLTTTSTTTSTTCAMPASPPWQPELGLFQGSGPSHGPVSALGLSRGLHPPQLPH